MRKLTVWERTELMDGGGGGSENNPMRENWERVLPKERKWKGKEN
jgi:hypothetical protein